VRGRGRVCVERGRESAVTGVSCEGLPVYPFWCGV
jgi:hypothetical protein